MLDHAPSATALRVAALRALHQTIDAPPIFVDPLAAPILGPQGAEILAAYRETADETARLRATLAVRTVVAEESIHEAVARGCRQCVILGAGLDTFAYRNTDPGLRVFEVDHPATQRWKRELLAGSGIAIPDGVAYVAVHLEREDLFRGLAGTGFERGAPAVFVMLGVTPYVARGTLLDLLGEMAGGPRGTTVAFDYTEPFHDAPEPVRTAYAAVAARTAAGGEPWVTFFEPAGLARALRVRGFAEIDDVAAPALQRRFCEGRTDALTIAPLVHVLTART